MVRGIHDKAANGGESRTTRGGGAGSRFVLWLRASRAQFFTAPLASVALGLAVAYWDGYPLSPVLAVVTGLGVALVNAGVNLVNDYHDQGTDGLNRHRSPFNGGPGLIQSGELEPRAVLRAGLVCFALAGCCGACLTLSAGPVVLALMAAGFVLGCGYSAKPLQLMRTGWGEVVAGLCCGPLVALGAYVVQTKAASWTVVWPSLPLGLLVSAILVINEVPDFEPDGAVAKNTLIVRRGQEVGIAVHRWLMYVTYGLVLLLPLLGKMPWPALAALATVPATMRALSSASAFGGDPAKIVPVSAWTAKLHVAVGLAISCSYLVPLGG